MTAPTERAKLKSLLVHGCGAPPNADEWETSPIGRSLIHNGVTGFDLLLLLSRENIQSLEIPAHRADGTDHEARKLSIADQQLLISAICAFHHYSNAAGKALRLASFPTNYYTVYRATKWNPSADIVPWNSPLRTAESSQSEREVSNWQKSIRISVKEFKDFKDEAYWQTWSESFKSKLSAFSLGHLIQDGYTPTNPDLDKHQRSFLYDVFTGIILTPKGKVIVKEHLTDKDTRALWKELEDHQSKSMVGIIKTARLSQYITSADIANGVWRGSQCEFLCNLAEQIRQYNDLSDNPYSEGFGLGHSTVIGADTSEIVMIVEKVMVTR